MQTNLMLKPLNQNGCGFFRGDIAEIGKETGEGQAHRHDREGEWHDDGTMTER